MLALDPEVIETSIKDPYPWKVRACQVGGCRSPSIKPGLKGNQSCYTSA